MQETFQIKLSSKELFILSALLGYESVFGVEDEAFLSLGTEMKPAMRRTVQRLERKKLIRYDLDGVLYVLPELRRIIDCICDAETVGYFSTNLQSGKKTVVYILEKETDVAILERAEKDKYMIYLSDTLMVNKFVPSEMVSSKPIEMAEMMLMEEAEYAQKQIESFDIEEAEKRIQKYTKNTESAKTIAKILSGNCGYMSVQIHRKSKHLYNAVSNGLFISVEGRTVSMLVDDNNVLHFDGVCPGGVMDYISPYLSLAMKKGTE